MKDDLRDVRLRNRGLNRVLGDREASIMEVLWGREDVAVREIHKHIAEHEDIAYTTVMTITDRLWRKGLLRRRKEGNAYLYTPVATRESFMASCLERILTSFLPDMTETSLSRFVDNLANEKPGLLDDLERLVRERKANP